MKTKAMEDAEDLGLKAVMGKKFRDCTQGGEVGTGRGTKEGTGKLYGDAEEKVMDARWKQIESGSVRGRTEIAVLKDCIKAMLPFGIICPVLLYWQISGLLDPQAAEVSLFICALLAGLRVGHAAGKGC